MPQAWPHKDPNEVLDYDIRWSEAEGWADGDTIATSTWTREGADTALTIASDDHDGAKATVWLSGGTPGVIYRLLNEITTADGRTFQDVATLEIVQK